MKAYRSLLAYMNYRLWTRLYGSCRVALSIQRYGERIGNTSVSCGNASIQVSFFQYAISFYLPIGWEVGRRHGFNV